MIKEDVNDLMELEQKNGEYIHKTCEYYFFGNYFSEQFFKKLSTAKSGDLFKVKKQSNHITYEENITSDALQESILQIVSQYIRKNNEKIKIKEIKINIPDINANETIEIEMKTDGCLKVWDSN